MSWGHEWENGAQKKHPCNHVLLVVFRLHLVHPGEYILTITIRIQHNGKHSHDGLPYNVL